MLILALDTTTRKGSLALMRDGQSLEVSAGNQELTHAARLPGEILECLARHQSSLGDVDLYAVAVGPGSFTGLRIGIATIQGLAFANRKPVVGVSALDALAEAGQAVEAGACTPRGLRAAWMDAQRGEVYGCLYRRSTDGWTVVQGPVVGRPADLIAAWAEALPTQGGPPVEFVGDGAAAHVAELGPLLASQGAVVLPEPMLAGAIATLALRDWSAGLAGPPARIHPLYIRRPDVELTRDRQRSGRG
jgi:tRNA threonylcarbamoyladenosine biosynthesis protein TsaB